MTVNAEKKQKRLPGELILIMKPKTARRILKRMEWKLAKEVALNPDYKTTKIFKKCAEALKCIAKERT